VDHVWTKFKARGDVYKAQNPNEMKRWRGKGRKIEDIPVV